MNSLTAVSRYHDLLSRPGLANDSWDLLTARMAERNMVFGERPLCTVLRPLFYSPQEWVYLVNRTELILRLFDRLARLMLDDDKLRAQIHATPEEEHLLSIDHGYRTTIPTARLDSFFARNEDGSRRLGFVEFNGECPASMAYSGVLAVVFLEMPVMQAFARRHAVHLLPSRRPALDEFLRVYYEWRGDRSKLPDIAIVDWRGVPTASEFDLFVEYFAEHGIAAVICDPDEMEFRNGQLFAAGAPVDFVYKRVLISELLLRYGLDHPIVDALQARAICLVNPFSCKLLHKKASLAVASDERNAHLLSAAEQQAVKAHIPWTRTVEERTTLDPAGNPIDLLPWASANRDGLVLKPNDEYGGKGVLIGWETEQTEWDAALAAASSEPAVVQERVQIAYEEFPAMTANGDVSIDLRLVDSDPFLFRGERVHGCLCRLSSETLLNVTAGGGSIVPVFMVEEKGA
ncbi:MAG: circularly permuted type 2 ATP-grasp protein [Caldilineaceae bacterium SB0670_bin_27]|nr:circularly permuted type 2 ATP-grasp protein [Caldilineaceae bacterium SB0670_bin_27]